MTSEIQRDGESAGGAARPASHPRTTAVAVGYLLASVGLLFSFGACCLWSLSSWLVKPDAAPPAQWLAHFSSARAPAAVLTVTLMATLVGGFGLIGVGIGLQGERRGSGVAAVILTGLLSVVYWAGVMVLAFAEDSLAAAWPLAILAVAATGLLALSIHAAAVMRRYPPPADQNVVTDEMLAAMERRKYAKRFGSGEE